MNARTIAAPVVLALLVAVLCTSTAMSDVLTFYPIDDTYIRMKSPDNNYGSSPTLTVRNRYGHWSHPDYWEQDTLVRFDLSSVPPGTEISSATLYLYYYGYTDTNPRGRDLTCHRIAEDWDEDDITWTTRPDYVSQATSVSIVPQQPGRWMAWDVANDVQAFVNDPEVGNYGWEIRDDEPWNDYNIPMTKFRSKEYGAFTSYLEVVPEPATLPLLAFGALASARARRVR